VRTSRGGQQVLISLFSYIVKNNNTAFCLSTFVFVVDTSSFYFYHVSNTHIVNEHLELQIKTLQTAPRREAVETLIRKVKQLGFE
jgi:hypothetical protein